MVMTRQNLKSIDLQLCDSFRLRGKLLLERVGRLWNNVNHPWNFEPITRLGLPRINYKRFSESIRPCVFGTISILGELFCGQRDFHISKWLWLEAKSHAIPKTRNGSRLLHLSENTRFVFAELFVYSFNNSWGIFAAAQISYNRNIRQIFITP